MRWELRARAAERGITVSAELRRRLAASGLVVSAGKMSGLWSGTPVSVRLADLEVICQVLACEPSDLLVREPTVSVSAGLLAGSAAPGRAAVLAGPSHDGCPAPGGGAGLSLRDLQDSRLQRRRLVPPL